MNLSSAFLLYAVILMAVNEAQEIKTPRRRLNVPSARNRKRQFESNALESIAPVERPASAGNTRGPATFFSCKDRFPGFYADTYTNCQTYFICLPDGRRYSSACGTGTVFNQRNLVCDHWYNYDCRKAEVDYDTNKLLQPFKS